jgi:Immunity protein 35
LVVLEEKTIEKEYGWIFFYDSMKSLEGDERYLIAGNAPLIVEKNDGSVHELPSIPPLEDWIIRYEAQRLK